MKKYIAGFRSNNPKNKKISMVYYILTMLFFMIGSSRSISDISLCMLLLATPSLVLNFKYLFGKNRKKQDKKIFTHTLIAYIAILIVFTFTAPEVNETLADESLLSTETIDKQNTSDKEEASKEDTSKNTKQENTENTTTDSTKSTNKAEIHFIDTGNSDAILIKEGNKAALIDGGDNDDETTVVSYLRNQGITELEYLFATHPDADHIGGLDAVVDSIAVKHVYVSNGDADTKTYADFIISMSNKNLSPSVPLLNSEFVLGTSKFKVLSVANTKDVNENSLVLEYTNGNDKALFMGDAGREIEESINVEDVDLIKVGHHGSKTSSDPSFIKEVSPKYAVITVGENNKYGHPHKETMDTLKSNGIEVHRNDECGNIVFISTGNGLKVDCTKGSYSAGDKKQESSTSSKNSSSTSSNVTSKPQQSTTNTSENTTSTSQSKDNGKTVYWTPNGKSYHTTKSCSTLSRSKVINSGTISQSGKNDPCDRCN